MSAPDLEGLPEPDVSVDTFVISFSTARFDAEAEPENDINPIRGHSVLAWLRPLLEARGFAVEGPATEDWGWHLEAQGDDARYLVGASAEPDEPGGAVEWILQFRKLRRLSEKLLGKNRMTSADPTLRWFLQLLRTQGDFEDLLIEAG